MPLEETVAGLKVVKDMLNMQSPSRSGYKEVDRLRPGQQITAPD
jgi:hypothetical protein